MIERGSRQDAAKIRRVGKVCYHLCCSCFVQQNCVFLVPRMWKQKPHLRAKISVTFPKAKTEVRFFWSISRKRSRKPRVLFPRHVTRKTTPRGEITKFEKIKTTTSQSHRATKVRESRRGFATFGNSEPAEREKIFSNEIKTQGCTFSPQNMKIIFFQFFVELTKSWMIFVACALRNKINYSPVTLTHTREYIYTRQLRNTHVLPARHRCI